MNTEKYPTYSDPKTPLPKDNQQVIAFGMGCFWGAERRMRSLDGVIDVEVGYSNGELLRTSYKMVLAQEKANRTGMSKIKNHVEVVKVIYDPQITSLETILALFFESHDPTQLNRQGNDIGSNYRSGIYFTTAEQKALAESAITSYQAQLSAANHGEIATEVERLFNYNRAEEEHQRYLQKYPNGYCGLGGLGVAFPKNSA